MGAYLNYRKVSRVKPFMMMMFEEYKKPINDKGAHPATHS